MYATQKNMKKSLAVSKESAIFAMRNDAIGINKVHTSRLNKALFLVYFQLADCIVSQNTGDNAFFIVPSHNQIFNRPMRNDVKNLQPTQDASVADVQPTKQATSIDSEKETTIIRPSAEAVDNPVDNPVETWTRRMPRGLSRLPFSNQPEMYTVAIRGTRNGERLLHERIISAYHPLMAIGQAVAEHFTGPALADIEDITLYQRVIKTIKPKK